MVCLLAVCTSIYHSNGFRAHYSLLEDYMNAQYFTTIEIGTPAQEVGHLFIPETTPH